MIHDTPQVQTNLLAVNHTKPKVGGTNLFTLPRGTLFVIEDSIMAGQVGIRSFRGATLLRDGDTYDFESEAGAPTLKIKVLSEGSAVTITASKIKSS